MPALLDEVRNLIKESFPDADVSQVTEENYRVKGIIYSPAFRELGGKERNDLVTKKVRGPLGIRGLNLGILVPLAPGETIGV